MSLLLQNTARGCINALQANVSRINILVPKRDKYKVGVPRLRNPEWFVRKRRTVHDDFITADNKTFIKEVISDKFGPPSLIKGVQTYKTELPKDLSTQLQTAEWNQRYKRCGAIARKIGVVPLWRKDGKRILTTMLQIVDNQVVKYIPPEEYQPAKKLVIPPRKKYGCLIVGAESTDPSLLTKDYCGLFADSGVMPKRILTRFFISPQAYIPPGTPINVNHFSVGDIVDVRGKTINRGFQGVMKRHGFSGMPATHGVTKTHRRGGNIGAGGEKARVWPGTKMPGHMGNKPRQARGLTIWRINTKFNVLWVSGQGIPGGNNSVVYIYDTILPLHRRKTPPPFPTAALGSDESLPDNIWSDELHDFKDSTIFYKPE
ncbi:39S ribosomal protein L3, mitochondrial [Pseudolycoriella hygida]|uniref:Large ribosomal subunit protein uL3m n=1 Tax=Pseudolycoriella hygida TaxID=35572 RepID=A0A9Q0S0U1_9DIPT|nr:39S ribosomal protein L3, mitochondrial [Pseudolycoriella hygida]